MDDSILLLESILEEVRKLNSKIEDVCAINKSGTVFQGIYDELYDIKEELSEARRLARLWSNRTSRGGIPLVHGSRQSP